jgi:MoaA/NifB/PqqE/SkfB family radical SAM enzyme
MNVHFFVNCVEATISNALSKRKLSTHHPFFVYFECTLRCNMRCIFCNVWRRNPCPDEASTEQLKKRLTECRDLGGRIVSFTGGEPLLRDDIGELTRFAKHDLGMYTGLVTNGLLLDKKVEEITDNLDLLAVSFDSINKDVFNFTRGTKSYDRVRKNIEMCARMGLPLNIFSTLTSDTVSDMKHLIEFARDLNADIHFAPVDQIPRDMVELSQASDLGTLDWDQVVQNLSTAKREYRKIHFDSGYFDFHASGGFQNSPLTCNTASVLLSLKPDGSVAFPCPFYTLNSIKLNDDLGQRWYSEELERLREHSGRWDFCSECKVSCVYGMSLVDHPMQALKVWLGYT